jgi:hypothetical protein
MYLSARCDRCGALVYPADTLEAHQLYHKVRDAWFQEIKEDLKHRIINARLERGWSRR